MSKFKTAKDILNSHDFLEAREKTQRYVRYEFQDYAYRLASDLGDIQHKAIYMKLAKSVDRTMLEQAAMFALEYFHESNKGKVFMWKLQQLRAAAQAAKDAKNFDPEFILKRMGELHDVLAKEYEAKFNAEYKAKLAYLQKLYPDPVRQRGYFCGLNSGWEALYLHQRGCKLAGHDISRASVEGAKRLTGVKKFVRRHNLEVAIPKADVIYTSLWPLLPLENESNVLGTYAEILAPRSRLIVELVSGESASQQWHTFNWKERDFTKFEKVNNLPTLAQQAQQFKLNLEQVFEIAGAKQLAVFVKS